MSDIFHEVDEALQRDRAAQLWQRYGSQVIGVCIAIILATAIYAGTTSWLDHRNAAQTDLILAATAGQESAPALAAIADQLDAPKQAVAGLINAGLDKPEGDPGKIYETIAFDSGAPTALRDLALLSMVQREAETAPDAAKAKPLLAHLAPLLKNADSPWNAQARLLAAVLSADSLRDYEGAKTHLTAIRDNATAPMTVQVRAEQLLHVYALRGQDAAKPAQN